MSQKLAKMALSRQVHCLKDRLAADPQPPVTYREHLVVILDSVENVLADENSDRQALKRSGYWIFKTVIADWSLGGSAIGQELLAISSRVQRLGD